MTTWINSPRHSSCSRNRTRSAPVAWCRFTTPVASGSCSIDLAHDAASSAPADLAPVTTAQLTSLLDPGLLPINPLDAWSTGGPDYHDAMQHCFVALMCDPGAAFGAVIHDRSRRRWHPSRITWTTCARVTAASGKPAFLVANRQGTGADAR